MCLKKKIASPDTINPKMEQQITNIDLRNRLKELFPDALLLLGENYRWLAHNEDIALFLAQDQTNKMEYVSDKKGISSYDCNVFANRLMGQFSIPKWCDVTFGKAWLRIPSHAVNCMLNQELEFFWVEPQTDELLNKNKYSDVIFIEM